jgi:hypothetical protein
LCNYWANLVKILKSSFGYVFKEEIKRGVMVREERRGLVFLKNYGRKGFK